VNIQFSELEGESVIKGKELDSSQVHISGDIEKSTDFLVSCSNGISLKESLSHFNDYLSTDSKCLTNFKESRNVNRITIDLDCKNPLEMGKLSWEDALRSKLTKIKENDV